MLTGRSGVDDLASALFPLLIILPVIDWMATWILWLHARRRPRVAFLTERAFAAFVVSIVTTVYAVIAWNNEQGRPIFDFDVAIVVVRGAIILLGAAPLAWLVLYLRRR